MRPRSTTITRAEVMRTIRSLGLSASRRDGEWRINFRGGREATAYYTEDEQDALDTADSMAHALRQVQAERAARGGGT